MFDSASGRRARQRKAGLARARQIMQLPDAAAYLQRLHLSGVAGTIAKAIQRRKQFADSLCDKRDCRCGVHQAFIHGGLKHLIRPFSKHA